MNHDHLAAFVRERHVCCAIALSLTGEPTTYLLRILSKNILTDARDAISYAGARCTGVIPSPILVDGNS